MNTKDLQKGKAYWYTAGAERVKVLFEYETLNKYVFTDGKVTNALYGMSVEQYIEEIKPE